MVSGYRKWWVIFVLLLLLQCGQGVLYKQEYLLQGERWSRDNPMAFSFVVQDTTQHYNLYLTIKYRITYPYQNVHFQHTLVDGEGNKLANVVQNLYLFEPKTGQSLGKGWGQHKQITCLMVKGQVFSKPGIYTVLLMQFMRSDPLLGITRLGFTVRKVQPLTEAVLAIKQERDNTP